MERYDHKFILNPEKYNVEVFDDHVYYLEFQDTGNPIIWWQEDDQWEKNETYTVDDFQRNLVDKIWLLNND